MISTEKLIIDLKSVREKKSNIERKQKLVARWKKVDGKLICQWTIA